MAKILFRNSESEELLELEEKRGKGRLSSGYEIERYKQLKGKKDCAKEVGISFYDSSGSESIVKPGLEDFKQPYRYFVWLYTKKYKEDDLKNLWGFWS